MCPDGSLRGRGSVDLTWLTDAVGDDGAAMLGGVAIGLLFGASAQRSQFCLRSATIEFWRGSLGPKTAIWLLAFGSALLGTQMLFASGSLETDTVRQLSTAGTMSSGKTAPSAMSSRA